MKCKKGNVGSNSQSATREMLENIHETQKEKW